MHINMIVYAHDFTPYYALVRWRIVVNVADADKYLRFGRGEIIYLKESNQQKL